MRAPIPASMRTRARRDGGDWVLNGTKMWITNGSIADVAVVWARTEDDGIRGFVVDEGTRAASARPRSTASCRCAPRSPPSSSSTTCACPRTPCSPGANSLRGPLSCLDEARYGIVWGAVGAARACFEAALDYAKERIVVRQADRRLPADAAEARRDGARDQPRPAARPPPRADEGRRARCGPSRSAWGKLGQRPRRARGLPAAREPSSAATGSRSSTRSSGT